MSTPDRCTHALSALFLLLLITAAGCGHVTGNYPVQHEKSLPTRHRSPMGHDTTLMWVEPDRIHGFLSLWRSARVRADAFRKIHARSGLDVHREAIEMWDGLADEGLAEAVFFVFFARGVEVICHTGDFEITFGDGAKVRDVGILRHETRDVNKPYRWTRDSAIRLGSEPVGEDEPLPVVLLVPAKHLGKTIEGVRFAGET